MSDTTKPALPEPDKLDPNEQDAVTLWAEIWRLRTALQGPDGYATWQDAATAERVRRVKAEAAVAEVNAFNGALTDKCNSYIIANARLAEQVAEARAVPKPAVRTDTARLDMLESDKMMRVFKIGKTWYWKPAYGMPHRKAKTLREAIDAALSGEQP